MSRWRIGLAITAGVLFVGWALLPIVAELVGAWR